MNAKGMVALMSACLAVACTAIGGDDLKSDKLGPAAPPAPAQIPPAQPADPGSSLWDQLSGTYEIIGMRRATETAAPLDLPGDPVDLRGQTITIGREFIEIPGAGCAQWTLKQLSSQDVMASDPMLDDLRLPFPGSDVPQPSQVFEAACEGEHALTLYQADPRAIAVPWDNGATYLIAERPLTPTQIRKFQEELAGMKFQTGPVSDAWTEAGLVGLRNYYAHRKPSQKAYNFERPAITASLLEGLNIPEKP